jgi:hypothetical protein
MSSEYGTHWTVKARSWPCHSGAIQAQVLNTSRSVPASLNSGGSKAAAPRNNVMNVLNYSILALLLYYSQALS